MGSLKEIFLGWAWPIIRTAITISFAQGILLYLDEKHQIYPDRWVATMIDAAATTAQEAPAWIGWMLVGGAGLLLSYLWSLGEKWFAVRRKQPITETTNLDDERRGIAEQEIATLTPDEKSAVRQMLVSGRPKGISDQVWQSLEAKTSFVERDFIGPKGIKGEFRTILESLLRNRTKDAANNHQIALGYWKPLSGEQKNLLFEILRQRSKHSVYVACGGPECMELANTFHDVFNRLDWPVIRGTGYFDAQGCEGIALTPCDDPAQLLRPAIEQATDFTVNVFQVSREQAGYDFDTMLIIGAKPWRAANT